MLQVGVSHLTGVVKGGTGDVCEAIWIIKVGDNSGRRTSYCLLKLLNVDWVMHSSDLLHVGKPGLTQQLQLQAWLQG